MSRVPITLLLASLKPKERMRRDARGAIKTVLSIPLGYTDREAASFVHRSHHNVKKVRRHLRRKMREMQRERVRQFVLQLELEHRQMMEGGVPVEATVACYGLASPQHTTPGCGATTYTR